LTVISKYLAKNIVTRILVVMFITSSIFLLFEYLNQSSNIGRSNFTLYTALEFSILKIPNIINKIIEISILIGGLYAFASLINNRELTIINSSGFSNFSVIKKTTLITFIFSFLSILIIDIVAPTFSKKADFLKTEALGQIFDYGQDGEFWMKKNKSFLKFVNHSKKNTYKDVLFFSLNERGQVNDIIYSDTASINQNNIIKFNDPIEIQLQDGSIGSKINDTQRTNFLKNYVLNDEQIQLLNKKPSELIFFDLLRNVNFLSSGSLTSNEYVIEAIYRVLRPINVSLFLALIFIVFINSNPRVSINTAISKGVVLSIIYVLITMIVYSTAISSSRYGLIMITSPSLLIFCMCFLLFKFRKVF